MTQSWPAKTASHSSAQPYREDSKLFRKIVKNDTPVLLGLDNDAHKKAMKLVKALLAYDIEVRLMDTSGYKDIGEMPPRCIPRAERQSAVY